jgi:hypothetical protein
VLSINVTRGCITPCVHECEVCGVWCSWMARSDREGH